MSANYNAEYVQLQHLFHGLNIILDEYNHGEQKATAVVGYLRSTCARARKLADKCVLSDDCYKKEVPMLCAIRDCSESADYMVSVQLSPPPTEPIVVHLCKLHQTIIGQGRIPAVSISCGGRL